MLTVNPGHFEAHRNLTEGDRLGDDAILEELLLDLQAHLSTETLVTRTLKVDPTYTGSVHDGSDAHPFITIQSAVDAAMLMDPIPSLTDSAIIDVAPGVYAENVVIRCGVSLRGQGVDVTQLAPTTGVPLVITNATLVSLAAFQASGDYAHLVYDPALQSSGAGPDNVNVSGMRITGPATQYGIMALGVKGDASAHETNFLALWGLALADVVVNGGGGTSTMGGLYARNVGIVSCQRDGFVSGWSDCYNCSYITKTNAAGGAQETLDMDLASIYGHHVYGLGNYMFESGVYEDFAITGACDVQLRNVNFDEFTVEDTSTASIRGGFTKGTVTVKDTSTLAMAGIHVAVDVATEAGANLTLDNCYIKGNLTAAAGAGVVALNGTKVHGTITDASGKITYNPDTFLNARNLYVSKEGFTRGDGSAEAPFLTIQAAVNAAEAAVPAATFTNPVVVNVGPGTFAEQVTIKKDGIYIKGAGQNATYISPATGTALTVTNATLASLALYRVAYDYTQLAAEAVPTAGPQTVCVYDLTLQGPAGGRALECLGVKGDAGAGATTSFLGYGGLRCYDVLTNGTNANTVFCRNACIVSFDGTNGGGAGVGATFVNTSYAMFEGGSLLPLVATYDAFDVLGAPSFGPGYFSFREAYCGNVTLNGAVGIDQTYNTRFWTFTANGTGDIKCDNCVFDNPVNLNDTVVATLRNPHIEGALSVGGGVTLTMYGGQVKGATTLAAGSGVVTANGTEFIGAITDASMKLVRAGDIVEHRARTGYPRVVGFTGAVAGAKADGSVNFALAGVDMLQGQAFAGKLVGAFLNLWCVVPGSAGNAEKVEVVDTGIGGLAVTYAAHKLTIDLGGAVGAAKNEATVATAINALAGCHGIIRADSTGTFGAEVAVTAEAPFLNGVGAGITFYEGGVEVFIYHATGATAFASITDTAVTLVPHDMTAHGFVATNVVAFELVSNGKAALPLGVPLIA